MKNLILLFIIILFVSTSKSQDVPKIGDTKDVKGKFLGIKKGISDLKKNLTKADPMWANEREVVFEMGNGIVIFEEDEEEESILIKYSSGLYFSGTLDDFKSFYNKLITIGKEVFGDTYNPIEENKGSSWQTIFVEKGKDIFKSPTKINVELSWVFGDPHIAITVSRKK